MIIHSKCYFRIHAANANPGTGLLMQLTAIEVDGVHAFVRENIRYERFMTNSTVRWAMAHGKVSKKWVQDVLELCAPADRWDAIARVVRRKDIRSRPVLKNRRFTVAWARDIIARNKTPFLCIAG